MPTDHPAKQTAPTDDVPRSSKPRRGAPAGPSPRAATEQAADNEKKALESGEESPA
jgi:hypothetical protein